MSIKDGGPAFPFVINDGKKIHWNEGMTLRDYFAAKAMQASVVATLNATKGDCEKLVKNSYVIADWMLKAREEG